MNKKINLLRTEIDNIDKELIRLLNKRAETVKKISELKKDEETLYRPEREAQLLKKAISLNKELGRGIITDEAIEFFFTQVMSLTFHLEKNLKIAYLGPKETNTHLAAIKRFGEKVDLSPCKDILTIFRAVEKGKADFGVVPTEHKTNGVVTNTMKKLMDTSLKICSEIEMQDNIEKCLEKTTRFFIIGKYETEPTGNDKTSIIFSAKDKSNELKKILSILKKHSIKLKKIESGPNKNENGECYFFVDMEGHQKDKKVRLSIEKTKEKTKMFKILGSYPKST